VYLEWVEIDGPVPIPDHPGDGRQERGKLVGRLAENWCSLAFCHQPLLLLVVGEGTEKVLVLEENLREQDSEDERRDESADEAFPSLLWRELDEGSFAEEKSKDVSHNIVENNDRDGEEKPNEALEDVLDDQLRLGDDDKQRNVRPTKHDELLQIVPFL